MFAVPFAQPCCVCVQMRWRWSVKGGGAGRGKRMTTILPTASRRVVYALFFCCIYFIMLLTRGNKINIQHTVGTVKKAKRKRAYEGRGRGPANKNSQVVLTPAARASVLRGNCSGAGCAGEEGNTSPEFIVTIGGLRQRSSRSSDEIWRFIQWFSIFLLPSHPRLTPASHPLKVYLVILF